jgi:hypothetical protein
MMAREGLQRRQWSGLHRELNALSSEQKFHSSKALLLEHLLVKVP